MSTNVSLSIRCCLICFILYFAACLLDVHRSILGIFFGVICFSFLFGSILFDRAVIASYQVEEICKYCFCLCLSITGIQIGLQYVFEDDDYSELCEDNKILTIRKIVNILFWLTIPFCFLHAIYRVYLTSTYGYVYMYANPDAFLTGPMALITKFSTMNGVLVVFLLATVPPIASIKKQIAVLFAYYFLLLLCGTRAGMLRFVFLIASYFVIIEYTKKNLNIKRIIKFGIVGIIGVILFSSIFIFTVQYRTGNDEFGIDKNPFVQLISSEGKSWTILINTFEIYKKTDFFDHIRFYFQPLFNSITFQFILSRIGLGFVNAQPYTVEYALSAYDYAHYYTFVSNSSLYLSGGGLGTSYLAEAFFLGQHFGILFHSVIIGLFLNKVTKMNTNNFVKNVYLFSVLEQIFWSPRGSAIGPFFSMFSFSYLIMFVVIYFAQRFVEAKR